MRVGPFYLKLLLAIAVCFCTGCATNFSAVVRCTPNQPWDGRTPAQLHADLNRVSPFEIFPGDIVVNKGFDGPSCWICLGDKEKTENLVRRLRQDATWKVTTVSRLRTESRPLFGFAPQPGSMLEGRTAAEWGTPSLTGTTPN